MERELMTLRQFMDIKSRWTYNAGFLIGISKSNSSDIREEFLCTDVDDFKYRYGSCESMLDEYYVAECCKLPDPSWYSLATVFKLSVIHRKELSRFRKKISRQSTKEKAFDILRNELMLSVDWIQGMPFLVTGMGGYTKITREQADILANALFDGDGPLQ